MESSATEVSDKIIKGKWQWRSNENPLPKSAKENLEEVKWTSYSLEQNYLLEMAYYSQQKEVDLGDYIVSIKDKLQTKKGNQTLQRPVRRIDWMENIEEMERSERYFETELPKTFNKVFGSLEDFLQFFSKRGPEIREFATQFNKFEEMNDLDGLNRIILPQLVNSFHEELMKPLEDQIGDPSISSIKKKLLLKTKRQTESLISSFQKDFPSFKKFYEQALTAYTMSTGLYLNLNRYLRNESWNEMNNLLSYAFCLFKAFSSLNPYKGLSKEKALRAEDSKSPSSMVLYRGTAFDELALSFYNFEKASNFSWNSATSTSKSQKVAENFMHTSADIKNKKYPVMFIIEVDILESSLEHLRWIDVQNISARPEEEEIILTPASVFELKEVSTDPNKITTIRIKLKNEVRSLAFQGFMMHGAYGDVMTTDRERKMMCLEDEELEDALKHLSGNRLIEELEFCLCKFDDGLLKKMIKVLHAMERIRGLKFVSCLYQESNRILDLVFRNFKNWNVSKINILDERHSIIIQNFNDQEFECRLEEGYVAKYRDEGLWFQGFKHLKHLKHLTSLNIDFSKSEQIREEEGSEFDFQVLKNLNQMTSMNLNFHWRKIINDDLMNLCSDELRHLNQLTSLRLNFSGCKQITDEGLGFLGSEGLAYLDQLTFLDLNFSNCPGVTRKGINNLCSRSLKDLTSLTSLSLKLVWFEERTNEKETNLWPEELKHLSQLRSLSLDFSNCHHITDERVLNLCSQVLSHMNQLTSLKLDFSDCEIGDNGVGSLCSEVLKHLTKLTSLDLNFAMCEITDEGMNVLGSQGLEQLQGLTCLSLNFDKCWTIKSEGVSNLCSQGLQHLGELKSLSLSFVNSWNIMDQGPALLSIQRLQYLKKLEILNLNCSNSDSLTDEGINYFSFEGLKNLKQLRHLTLNLSLCEQITDRGIKFLSCNGLQHLDQLVSLNLDFSCCSQLTSEGIKYLFSQGLIHLKQLNSLNLDFSECKQIVDEGVRSLSCQGLENLRQLKSLSLDFSGCHDLTSEGLNHLYSNGLKHMNQLKSLKIKYDGNFCLETESNLKKEKACNLNHLILKRNLSAKTTPLNPKKGKSTSKIVDFSECRRKMESVNNLLDNIRDPSKLRCLNLDFSRYHEITDQAIDEIFSSPLKKFVNLTSLTLNFSGCSKLLYKRMDLEKLKSLNQLTVLNLSFSGTHEITDGDFENLYLEKLKHLRQLTSLNLDFSECKKITGNGMKNFGSYGLKYLGHLTSLRLDFSVCPGMTDIGLDRLASHGLVHLIGLSVLELNFSRCYKITNQGLKNLCSKGLKSLKQLTSLSIDFAGNHEIKDVGVKYLCSEGLNYLSQLVSLSINLSGCEKITDEGVNNLCSQGIKYLRHLELLNINLTGCAQITEFTMKNIVKVLNYFGFTSVNSDPRIEDSITRHSLG